ncbi:MAG: SAM-dependent methyltransferase [Oligoflexus sp.]
MAANSLGLPDDIPTRSLNALRQSDLLIFEEDRQARQSLKAAGIHRDYYKFTEHLEEATLHALRLCLQNGGTACYMSDQGMPVVADPGQQLLKIAYELHASLEIIPGPSSITAALAACPFLQAGFRFLGFLPRDPQERMLELERLKVEKQVLVVLDTPYRRQPLLQAAAQAFGDQRQALLALDISGPQEAYHLGSLSKLADLKLEKLNFVLIIEGFQPTKAKKTKKKSSTALKKR